MQSLGVPTAAPPENEAPMGGSLGRYVFYGITLIVLASLAYLAWTLLRPQRPPAPSISTVPARLDSIVGVVNSTGQIAPWTQAKLSFRSPGQIESISVKVGDRVKKGDVLASLTTTDLQIQVEQSQANLETAKAKLAAIQAGARPEEVQVAQAVLDAAQAKLDGMLAGGRPEEVKAAEAALASARARLHELQMGTLASDLAAAQTAVEQSKTQLAKAQADLANLQRPADPLAIKNAQLAVDQAKNDLWKTQTTRDGVCGDPVEPAYKCQAANSAVATAQTAIDQAQNKLAMLQQGPKPEDVAAAKAAVASATALLASNQARLAQLKQGPLPDEIAQAAASVAAAEQTLALKRHPYTDYDIAQQRQVVAQAAAQLALKKAPYTQADLDAAKAAVDQAQAQLELAQYNLQSAKIIAPFDGTVAAVNAGVGEAASASAANPVITLVDPNNLRLDVNVDETDISHVQLDQDVTVTFDALPGQTFAGKVIAIGPNAAVQSGVAAYTVSINLLDPTGVKPGMTGNADIIFARHENALVIPNRAVHTDGERRYVNVLEGNKVVERTVTVGVSDDKNTEITSGLNPGDQVVVPSTAPTLPGFAGGPRR